MHKRRRKRCQPRTSAQLLTVATEFLLILTIWTTTKDQINAHDAVMLLQLLLQLHH